MIVLEGLGAAPGSVVRGKIPRLRSDPKLAAQFTAMTQRRTIRPIVSMAQMDPSGSQAGGGEDGSEVQSPAAAAESAGVVAWAKSHPAAAGAVALGVAAAAYWVWKKYGKRGKR